MSNVQHEITTCIAYYGVVKQCLENAGRPDRDAALIQKTDATISALQKDAFEIGTSIGMTQDAMLSRLRNELSQMKLLISNSCVNTSSLLNRHALRCKQVVENQDSILGEYLRGR